VKLEDVADIRSGNGFPIKYQGRTEGEFPFFKVGDISRNWQKGMITLTNGEHCLTQAEVKAIRAKTLPAGSVVFAKIGAAVALNRRAILGVESLVDNNVMALVPAATTTSRFLFYFMCQVDLGASTRGGAVPSLRRGDVADLEIPLPPLPEQRRIVARIEELFSRLDAGVAALRQAKAQLQRYRQSVLAAAVTGQLTQAWREQHPDTEPAEKLLERILNQRREQWNGRGKYKEPVAPTTDHDLPENWVSATSDQLLQFVTSGSRGWAEYYSEEGAIFLRIGNLEHEDIALDLDDIQRVMPPEGAEGSRTRVQTNDILISITADVGMVALVDTDIGEAYINQHVALARPSDEVNPRFLAWLFASKPTKVQWKLLQRGATKVGLGLDDIRAVQLGLPPLAEQYQIVAEVEARTTAIDHLEAELDRKITRSNRLRQSTLAAAFAGNLL
jgi:type I restriction enzyme S subunit